MENKTTRNADQKKSTDSSNIIKRINIERKKCKYIVSGMIISMMIMMLIVKTKNEVMIIIIIIIISIINTIININISSSSITLVEVNN